MSTRVHLSVTFLVALLLAGGAARSTGSGDGGGEAEQLEEPAITSTPSAAAGAVQELPLRAYALTPEQMQTTSRAEGLLMQDCMRRLGFTAWQPPEPGEAQAPLNTGLRIGIVDAQQAGTYGYHNPAATRKARSTEQPTAQERAELAALSGDAANAGREVPEGGCSGEATRRLREGAPESDPQLYGRLWEEADQATESDSRVVSALDAWSACMTAAGFTYRTPWEASEQTWAAAPTPAEIALARADVECKAQTGLAGIWIAVTTGYQQQLIDRNRAGLEAVREAVNHQLRRADEVLRSGGGR